MTTMLEVATSTRSIHRELTAFVESEMENNATISVDALVRRAHQRFGQDAWMIEALFREGLKALLPGIAADARHARRTEARRKPIGDKERRDKIASVFEHIGGGVSKSVLSMCRPDHQYALEQRETAVAGHMRWIGFHREVIDLHTDDVTVTGDLPADKVARIWRQHIETG